MRSGTKLDASNFGVKRLSKSRNYIFVCPRSYWLGSSNEKWQWQRLQLPERGSLHEVACSKEVSAAMSSTTLVVRLISAATQWLTAVRRRRHQGAGDNRLRKWLEVINYWCWLALMTENERPTPLVGSMTEATSHGRHANPGDMLVPCFNQRT